jgi:hypothetical protein
VQSLPSGNRPAVRRYEFLEALGEKNDYTVSAITLRVGLHSIRSLPNGGTADDMCNGSTVGKVEPHWVDKNHPCPVCALTNQHHGIIDRARADRKHLWNGALILHGFCIAPTRV